jgi:hypothetical protein
VVAGRLLPALALLLVLALPRPARAAALGAGCRLQPSFQALHDLIPAVVGDCTSDANVTSDGDAQQATTRGLLVFRKADAWTAFTDGATTWIVGPCGLQSRANDASLPWERGGACEASASMPDPTAGHVAVPPTRRRKPSGQSSAAPPAAGPIPAPPTPSQPRVALPSELQPAWDLLHSPQAGDLGNLADTWAIGSGVSIGVGPLPAAWGAYSSSLNRVLIAPDTAADLPAATAAVLVHELRHAAQRSEGDLDCVHREVDAARWESLTWERLGGGVAAPASGLQRQETALLNLIRTEGDTGLYQWIVGQPGYQRECSLTSGG